MAKRARIWLRDLALALLRPLACDIRDFRTGEKLARALVIPWRGKILFIGLEGKSLLPRFLPQDRLTFWKQELGFTSHPTPDFPTARPAPVDDAPGHRGGG